MTSATEEMLKLEMENAALVARVNKILSQASFFNYEFVVRVGHGGVFLQGRYYDKDIYTEREELQHTRKWLISPYMTDSEIVQTAFKLCMTSFEHRCREGFKYHGHTIYGPHFHVEDLVRLCRDGREAAGGRPSDDPTAGH
jgi:hypothetical protein